MKKTLLVLQLIITLLVLAFVPSNLVKTLILLPVWWMSFGGFSKREWISFFLLNILFILNDIGAIQNNFFHFTQPDLFGLPYWEFFMWGFYLLHLHRMFPAKVPKSLDLKLVILALIFAQVFAIIPDRSLLLIVTTSVLVITFIFYHEVEDFLYCFYLMIMGIAVETVGLTYNLWSYPETDYNAALVQFVVMWGAIGVYFRHIMGGWLLEKEKPVTTYRGQQPQLPAHIQPLYETAKSFVQNRQFANSLPVFTEIQKQSHQQNFQLHFDFYRLFSEASLAEGNMRAAIELLREALKFAGSPIEKSETYVQLCRVYRMMILMKNARMELGRAFAVIGLDMPKNSFFRTAWAFIQYAFSATQKHIIVKDEDQRRLLRQHVVLYEEAGLSAYYFREDLMLAQCSLKSKRPAMCLGDSLEMVNWLGGSGCVWAVLGWHSRGRRMIERALSVGQSLNSSYVVAKALLWKALFLDYSGLPNESAREFEQVLSFAEADLNPSDRRLVATTLSCNYLMRGQMRASEAVIRKLTESEHPTCRYFSSGRAYVDWYRLPAISFLQESHDGQEILKTNSQIAFFRVDEEKWQITQFLGGLLMHHYSMPQRNLADIQACLTRFELLNLPPEKTYLEACHFWIAKAHLMIDLAFEGKVSINEAEKAVKDLKRTIKHPNTQSHARVARAKCALLKPNPSMPVLLDIVKSAESIADSTGNLWVKYESLRFQQLMHQRMKDDAKAAQAAGEIRRFCTDQDWKGMIR